MPNLGGTGSVLAIWSLIVVVIGSSLFIYGIVVTVRGRRRRRRRRRAPMSPMPRPIATASRPLALPSGPTVGGVPVGRPMAMPRAGGLQHAGGMPHAGAMPRGPGSRPLALPGPAPRRYPSPPPPVALPSAGSRPAALPAGPIAGSGYVASGPYSAPPGDGSSHVYGNPGYGNPVSSPPLGPAISGIPAISSSSAVYGVPPSQPAPIEAIPIQAVPIQAVPIQAPTQLTPAVYGNQSGHAASYVETRALPAAPSPELSFPTEQTSYDAKPHKRRGRADECAALREQCVQLQQIADAASVAAAQAATEAEAAHADYVAAQRNADEVRGAHDAVVREAAEIAAQIAHLERTAVESQPQLQAETTHAAFAAYRRGDITSEQLREVFRRAEGWTPEHDRLSRRSTELRAEEAEAIRARDGALLAEQGAAERAHIAAISARALDDEARTAAADARGRCAAADACEQRRRR